MTDRDCFVHEDEALARTLLAAGSNDGPSERALQRTLRAVSGAAPLAIAAATGKAHAAAKIASAGVVQSGATAGLLIKWGAAGFALGAVVLGTAVKLAGPPSMAKPMPALSAPRATSSASARVPQAQQPVVAPRLDQPVPLMARPARASTPAPAPEPVAKRTADADGLAREAMLLDHAREALRSGDRARARTLLETHAAVSPKRMEPEALLLRMELAVADGDTDGARAAGQAILQRFATTPQAARARAILDRFDSKGEMP